MRMMLYGKYIFSLSSMFTSQLYHIINSEILRLYKISEKRDEFIYVFSATKLYLQHIEDCKENLEYAYISTTQKNL